MENMTKHLSGKDVLRAALSAANAAPLAAPAARRPFDPTPYLTEMNQLPPVTSSLATITDALKPQPLPHHRPYVSARRGIDAAVEVENAHVFRYDSDVAPMIAVLVNKSVEQAVIEVHEETELAKIRQYRRDWEARRDLEVKETERKLAEEVRRASEHAALLKSGRELLGKERRFLNKIKAMKVSVGFVSSVFEKTLSDLEVQASVFITPESHAIESDFIPLLAREACDRLVESESAKNIVSSL
jgi:radial spoke head protein 3